MQCCFLLKALLASTLEVLLAVDQEPSNTGFEHAEDSVVGLASAAKEEYFAAVDYLVVELELAAVVELEFVVAVDY